MMAGCVKFHVTLHATGTHAGYPHKGTGPIEALATMILALQTIVSRNVSPFHPLVLSITELHGGHVWNVVPAKASFQGTVRYFHKSDGIMVGERFKEQVNAIAAGYGITADIDWDDFQDPLVSDEGLSKIVADDVREYAQLEPIHPSMAGRISANTPRLRCPCSPSSDPMVRKDVLIGIARILWDWTNPCRRAWNSMPMRHSPC